MFTQCGLRCDLESVAVLIRNAFLLDAHALSPLVHTEFTLVN